MIQFLVKSNKMKKQEKLIIRYSKKIKIDAYLCCLRPKKFRILERRKSPEIFETFIKFI